VRHGTAHLDNKPVSWSVNLDGKKPVTLKEPEPIL
jgi:hypothetical protein